MVLIIGAGYIGEAVASLLSDKTPVVLTTKSHERAKYLIQKYPFTYVFDVDNLPQLQELVSDQDAIIVTLGAKSQDDYESTYLKAALNLREILAENDSVKQIIYTSSSSVYGDHAGQVVTESSATHPSNEQTAILKEAEEVFLSLQSPNRNVCIFRLSEIYGPGREISLRIKHYKGKKAPGDGLQPTNMIHQEDVAKAICFALKHRIHGIYNLCDDDHMSRKNLYDKVSSQCNLPYVEFDPSLRSMHQGKKVLSNFKIKQTGFSFTHLKRHLN